jgi:hypothetical protein
LLPHVFIKLTGIIFIGGDDKDFLSSFPSHH